MKSIRQLALEYQEAERIGDKELAEELEWEIFKAQTDAESIREIQKYETYKLD